MTRAGLLVHVVLTDPLALRADVEEPPSSMSCFRWRAVSPFQISSIDEAKTLAVLVRPS